MKKFSLNSPQIGLIGTLAGIISVFGSNLFGLGFFVLVYQECGSHAGFLTKVGGVCLIVLYFLCVIIFFGSIGLLCWRKRSGPQVGLLPFIPVALLLFIGIHGCSKGYLARRAEDAVFYGDLELYRKISTEYDQSHLNDDLWMAARWGHLDLVKYLISRGANPNGNLGDGGDSILRAAHANLGGRPEHNKAVIDCLIQAGAKESPKNEELH